MNENNVIEIMEDMEQIEVEINGVIVKCDILFTFDSEDTMRSYIGYTDHSFTDGKKNIYVNAIDVLNPDAGLQEITDSRELRMVNEVIKQIKNS